MARNKKKQGGGLRFGLAVRTILLVVLIGGSCVGYVLQKNKIHSLGREKKTRENSLEKLEWENKALARRLADLQLPLRLDARVKELDLGLVPPAPDQIIWLRDPGTLSVSTLDEERDREVLAARQDLR